MTNGLVAQGKGQLAELYAPPIHDILFASCYFMNQNKRRD